MIHFLKTKSVLPNAFILVALSLLGAFLLWMMAGWVFPFTCDSILYITTAENIAHFKGILSTNIFVQPPIPNVLPMHLTPPGYPISIAVLKWAGVVNEYIAALFLARLSYLFLPFLFFSVFRRFFSENVSLIAAGICSLSFSVLSCSVIAWSDTPYLSLSLLILIMMFNIIEKRTCIQWSYVVLTGILSGFAFLLRYVGISLLVSIGFTLIVAAMLKAITFKDFVRVVLLGGLGLCLPVVPFCIRNLIVFGAWGVTPPSISVPDFFYHMSFVIPLYLKGLSLIIFGVGSLAWFILILIISSLVYFFYRLRDLLKLNQTQFICLVLVLAYFLIYSIFLIGNKSQAFLPGNPDIDDRVMIQLSWIIQAVIIFVIYKFIKNSGLSKQESWLLAGFLITVFVVIQIVPLGSFYQKQKEIKILSRKIAEYHFYRVPADYVIVSNVPEITYYFARRNVRALSNYTPDSLLYYLGRYRRFVVFLVKGCGHLSPAWQYGYGWDRPSGYKKVYSDDSVELLVPNAGSSS